MISILPRTKETSSYSIMPPQQQYSHGQGVQYDARGNTVTTAQPGTVIPIYAQNTQGISASYSTHQFHYNARSSVLPFAVHCFWRCIVHLISGQLAWSLISTAVIFFYSVDTHRTHNWSFLRVPQTIGLSAGNARPAVNGPPYGHWKDGTSTLKLSRTWSLKK